MLEEIYLKAQDYASKNESIVTLEKRPLYVTMEQLMNILKEFED